MSEHTPGPWTWTIEGEMDDNFNISRVAVDWNTWECKGHGGNPCLTDSNGEIIVSGGYGEYMAVEGKTREQEIANSNLIAAAPDMYELLRKFREDVAFDDFALSKFMEQVVSILDKLD